MPEREIWVGAFYNPHLGRDLLHTRCRIDHLAMADPPPAQDPCWPAVSERYTLLLHDYLGQLADPLSPAAVRRAQRLAALYDTPWVAEHFQCLHTVDGAHGLDYVFPPLYTEEFLDRFAANASALEAKLEQPLVMENIPGFFEVRVPQMSEPEWLRAFFERTGCGFLLDLPHVLIEARQRGVDPLAWLQEFPLEHVVEVHVAGLEDDGDLAGPWVSPRAPTEEILDLMVAALAHAPSARAVTFDAFSPSLPARVLFDTVERIRARL